MKNKGYSLIELMISFSVLAAMGAIGFLSLSQGQGAYFVTDAASSARNNLRATLMRVSGELEGSGHDSGGTFKVTITDGGGVSNSDILRFSLPIVCEATGNLINTNGDVANWGAPLTWGCTDSTCMDADDDCSTEDYEFIEYYMNASGSMMRRVLSGAQATVVDEQIAQNITDFQVAVNAGETIVTLTITGTATSKDRTATVSRSLDVYLRN